MKRKFALFFLLLALVTCPLALARPVTYRDGARVAFESHPTSQDVGFAYSVSSHAALGFEALWHAPPQGARENAFVFKWDHLWLRANHDEFQASLYSVLGLGFLYSGSGEHSESLHLRFGLNADAENRRLYAGAGFIRGVSPRLTPSDELRLRAGFAPYLAEFEQLQNWVLLQYDVESIHGEESAWVGPVLRFTYKNLLWEAGALARPANLLDRSFFFAFETVF
jgi:hypothetical protein